MSWLSSFYWNKFRRKPVKCVVGATAVSRPAGPPHPCTPLNPWAQRQWSSFSSLASYTEDILCKKNHHPFGDFHLVEVSIVNRWNTLKNPISSNNRCFLEELRASNYLIFHHTLAPEGITLVAPLMQITLLIQLPEIAVKPGFYFGGICHTDSWCSSKYWTIAWREKKNLTKIRLYSSVWLK